MTLKFVIPGTYTISPNTRYSPLHNITVPPPDVQYPAVLLLTADHDDRVVPLHSFKFISQLQHTMKDQQNQVRVQMLIVQIQVWPNFKSERPTVPIIPCSRVCRWILWRLGLKQRQVTELASQLLKWWVHTTFRKWSRFNITLLYLCRLKKWQMSMALLLRTLVPRGIRR